ncbi:hypothetical protein HPB49_021335 [Dermacentor silvarum]|uniref:Uncharacterized protein n=1 Tax=Dermacentor silvarum TaxID=543639 RepID=A0ACB8D7Z4_DERSI|nr:hypothetical protein HPB49_021335 [Dermacentor silvarum]
MLKAVEMSSQEGAWFLLKEDMSHKSRYVIYIPTCLPEHSTRVRKTREQIVTENLDERSTNVWKHNIIQTYEDRPASLENICLADIVANYCFDTRRKQNVERKQQSVIRFRHYTADTPLDYKR